MKDNQHEQLFTELTPAEAAVVEGGLAIFIDRVHAIKAGGSFETDNTIIKVNGMQYSPIVFPVRTGETNTFPHSFQTSGNRARVEFFRISGGSPKSLGSFVATAGRGQRATVSGNGSIYHVAYTALK
jgi:hypothetical protein